MGAKVGRSPVSEHAQAPLAAARRNALVPPSMLLQAKLIVSAANDPYEREADRVADQVFRDPTRARPAPARAPLAIQRLPAGYQGVFRQAEPDFVDEDEEEGLLQAKSPGGGARAAPDHVETALSSESGGSPLPRDLRADMESGFGHSFDRVRVHSDPAAADLSDSIAAQAFTHGDHIYFGEGRYSPQSGEGRRLIAHELTHTIQQRGIASTLQRKKKKKPAFDTSRLTDEEKIARRHEFRERATKDIEQTQEELKDAPDLSALGPHDKAKLRDWHSRLDQAIKSADKITDPEQGSVRGNVLRGLKRMLDDKFFVHAHLKRKFEFHFDVIDRASDPTVQFPSEALAHWRDLGALLDAGAPSYLRYLHENWLYAQAGIDPEDLDTPEISAEEAAWGGGDGGEPVLEDRKIMEQIEAVLEQAGSDAEPLGDREALLGRLKKMTQAERDEFFHWILVTLAKREEGKEGDLKTIEQMLDMFNGLSPTEREVLRVNRELSKEAEDKKDPLAGEALLKVHTEAEKARTLGEKARSVDQNLDLIRSLTLDPTERKALDGLSLGADLFFEEVAMLLALLAGGASRSKLVEQAAKELTSAIMDLQERVQKELAWASLTAFATVVLATPTAGASLVGGAATVVRLKKLIDLIAALKRAYDVKNRIERVVSIVSSAATTYESFKAFYARATTQFRELDALLDQLESSEGLEETIEAKEEELMDRFEALLDDEKFSEILDLMYIPDDTSPEELQQILFEIPEGITALEQMWDFYRGGDTKSPDFVGILSARAFLAGSHLYPFVGLTAALIATEVQSAFPEKSVEDRINKLIPKGKRGAGLKQRNRGFFGRLNRKNYKYNDADLRPHLTAGKKRLQELIEDDEKGKHWAPAWFKLTLRREIKTLNKEFRGKTVPAKRKAKKGKGVATPEIDENVPLPPFRVRVHRGRKADATLKATLKLNPEEPLEVDRLSVDDFKTGVDYIDTPPRRQTAVRNWLDDAGYQLTRDTKNREHVRIPKGDQESALRPYLRIDYADKKIKKGIDKDDWKPFEGKLIEESHDLPEGYHLVNLKTGEDTVSLKGGLAIAGHVKLGLDDGHKLKEGEGRAKPREVAKPGMTEPTSFEGYDYVGALDAMFKANDPLKPDYNLQDRAERYKWDNHLTRNGDLKQRPKAASGRLGYIINARALGDKLGGMVLPELHKKDDKGHLVARRFGGIDSFKNLVPMKRSVNQFPGKWFDLEHDMAQVFIGKTAKPNHHVEFDLTLTYPHGKTRRPDKLKASFQEKDDKGGNVGGKQTRTIDND
jgi:hypothetical protein